MDNQVLPLKDADCVVYYNATGSAISKDDMVELGTDPDTYVAVAQEDIAIAGTGLLKIFGRFKYEIASGNGGPLGAPYYKSSATLITLTGTSVTAFCGYGASSIIVGGSSLIEVDFSRARPNFET